jgi:hypothetical protein
MGARRKGRLSEHTEGKSEEQLERNTRIAFGIILAMAVVAVALLVIGCRQGGFDWSLLWKAGSLLVSGTAFVAVGLLELEWLERVVGFADTLFSGVTQFLWTSWSGNLSDSDLVGRRGARVIWIALGVVVFICGCLLALRII